MTPFPEEAVANIFDAPDPAGIALKIFVGFLLSMRLALEQHVVLSKATPRKLP